MMDERIRRLIGEKVASLRKQAGYRSQRALAEKVGDVNPSFISQIETGRSRIPDDRLEAFAEALGVDPRELQPQSLGQRFVSGVVQSMEDLSDWRDAVLRRGELGVPAQIILLSWSAPPFLNRDQWISTVTQDQFIRETGRSRELVEKGWDEALESGFVERIGEVRWVLRLRFPED